MARFHLHYGSHSVELPIGEFVVGRGGECTLVVDDASVSRRHVMFRITRELVIVHDLNSANGVRVNGKIIVGSHPLRSNDVVTIGVQEFRLEAVDAPNRHAGSSSPGFAADVTLAGIRAADGSKDPLLVMADQAISAGKLRDAGTLVQRFLARELKSYQAGRGLETLPMATDYALKLAGTTSEGSWIDWLFNAYAACGKVLPVAATDELYTLVRKIRPAPTTSLRAYVQELTARAEELGPGDRFQLKRLEGLIRLALAG